MFGLFKTNKKENSIPRMVTLIYVIIHIMLLVLQG